MWIPKVKSGRQRTKLPVVVALTLLGVAATLGSRGSATENGVLKPFLVTNDDTSAALPPSTVTFYDVGADGRLTGPSSVSTGANGIAGGYFGIARVLLRDSNQETCVYASNAQSENIAAIDAHTRKLTGVYRGSRPDNKLARNGIGLAMSSHNLYAAFSGSKNIGVFETLPGCKLQFADDVHAQGLNGGAPEGVAIHGSLMIVTYGDGSVESFDVSGKLPVSNGDAQYPTNSYDDLAPGAVDITRDGHYAIFGGGSTVSAVEVSDISSGKLTPATVYSLGTAWNSGSVRLSPDERVLYVSNNSGGRVTAAFFDKSTGKIRRGCTSSPLRGFYSKFTYVGAVASELATGTGGLLYVPEFASRGSSHIGMLRFTQTSTGCTLTETATSPVAGVPGSALLSIGVYPPRPF